MKNKVVMFEIPSADFQKAKTCYETVFAWRADVLGDEGAMARTTTADDKYNPTEPGGINEGLSTQTQRRPSVDRCGNRFDR